MTVILICQHVDFFVTITPGQLIFFCKICNIEKLKYNLPSKNIYKYFGGKFRCVSKTFGWVLNIVERPLIYRMFSISGNKVQNIPTWLLKSCGCMHTRRHLLIIPTIILLDRFLPVRCFFYVVGTYYCFPLGSLEFINFLLQISNI